jgi:hypothetical protein
MNSPNDLQQAPSLPVDFESVAKKLQASARGRRSRIHAEINDDTTKRGRIEVLRISHYTIMMSRHNQIISAV